MKLMQPSFISLCLKVIVFCTLIAVFAFSCASFQTTSSSNSLSGSKAIYVKPPSESGLQEAGFKSLPTEAKEYLETLSEAFRKKDKEFLLAQGEAQFEKELRPKLEEGNYLALLYRIGPYSEDSEWKAPTTGASPIRLDVNTTEAILYTGWEEKGPLLGITGRLYTKDSGIVPCRIVLAWRLVQPKIQGVWP